MFFFFSFFFFFFSFFFFFFFWGGGVGEAVRGVLVGLFYLGVFFFTVAIVSIVDL